MRNAHKNPRLAGISLLLVLFTVVSLASAAFAQQQPPLVYTQENTGANYPPPVIPDFPQLRIIRPLPDPFLFFDGTRDTSFAAFEHHRNEWKYAIEQNEIGPKPDCHDCVITAAWAPTANSTAGTSGTLTVTVTRITNNVSLVLTSGVTLPAGTGPFPFVIGISLAPGNGPFTGSMPASMFPKDKIATVAYVHDQVAQYAAGQQIAHDADPFYLMYPELCSGKCPATGSNSGEYAAWSWGVSRLLDGIEIASRQLQTPLPLDISHSAITGCSYAGKMALFSGAFDERIALTIAQENGGGGAPSWRVSHEIESQGSVEDADNTDYSWFAGDILGKFAGSNVYKLPEDHHELMAMVAPRALVQTGDSLYYWLGDRSATIDSLATEKIYSTYGIGDRFGYYIDSNHSHCAVPAYEQAAIQPFINRFLLGQDVDTHLAVSWQLADALQNTQQPTIDPNMWTAWWGTNNPSFPNNTIWNSGSNVMLPLNQNLTVSAGDTVSTSFGVQMPGNHQAATVTYPYGFVETDITCPDSSYYTLKIPIAGQSFSIAAGDNSVYTSTPATTAVPAKCAGAAQATGAWFFALGKQSPGAGNTGGPGFLTTDGTQAAAQTEPLNVTFNISSNGVGGAWAPAAGLNFQNPYACTPPGCPLTPIIQWAAPSNITYPTPVNSTQLNASASALQIAGMQIAGTSGLETPISLPGTFTYSTPAGTVLHPGTYLLSTAFTPDAVGSAYGKYTVATASVPIIVSKAASLITWAAPSNIKYPKPLNSTQLNATASVPGTFVYSPPAGTVLKPGTYTLKVTFTPTDSVDYTTATASVPLTVTK